VEGELTSSEDGGAGGVHALYDEVVQHHLVLGPLDDVLVHAGLRHQPAARRKQIYQTACIAAHPYRFCTDTDTDTKFKIDMYTDHLRIRISLIFSKYFK